MSQNPRIWVLLGHRTGDNNQLLALAEALGLPFETRTLKFNALRIFRPLLGATIATLDRRSRAFLSPPWPDIVIGIGWRSVAAARWIKRRNHGRTRLVRLGNPRTNPGLFDIVVTTPQYPVADADNVLRLPLGMSRFRDRPVPDSDESAFLQPLPKPRLLLAVGGPAKFWSLSASNCAESARRLANRARGLGGSLIAVTSPRTPPEVTRAVSEALGGSPHAVLVAGRRPRFSVLLAESDEIFVTGDSVAMLSEAVLSGKPVGIVPVESTPAGIRRLGDQPDSPHRDLRRFWQSLQDRGLAGTIDRPIATHVDDPAEAAAEAVVALLGHRFE